MDVPLSLSAEILQRVFRGSNGEIGLRLGDTAEFLTACAKEGIAVLGWEAWLIDHAFDSEAEEPKPSLGHWCGLIPSPCSTSIAVIGGEAGDMDPADSWRTFVDRTVAETQSQLTRLDVDREVAAAWHSYLRVNFTLVEETDRIGRR